MGIGYIEQARCANLFGFSMYAALHTHCLPTDDKRSPTSIKYSLYYPLSCYPDYYPTHPSHNPTPVVSCRCLGFGSDSDGEMATPPSSTFFRKGSLGSTRAINKSPNSTQKSPIAMPLGPACTGVVSDGDWEEAIPTNAITIQCGSHPVLQTVTLKDYQSIHDTGRANVAHARPDVLQECVHTTICNAV